MGQAVVYQQSSRVQKLKIPPIAGIVTIQASTALRPSVSRTTNILGYLGEGSDNFVDLGMRLGTRIAGYMSRA